MIRRKAASFTVQNDSLDSLDENLAGFRPGFRLDARGNGFDEWFVACCLALYSNKSGSGKPDKKLRATFGSGNKLISHDVAVIEYLSTGSSEVRRLLHTRQNHVRISFQGVSTINHPSLPSFIYQKHSNLGH